MTVHSYRSIGLLILLLSISGAFLLTISGRNEGPNMNQNALHEAGQSQHDLKQQYDLLITGLLDDLARDSPSRLSSTSQYRFHGNFAKIVALGHPVLQYVALDLHSETRHQCSAELMDAILPEVDLGMIFGTHDHIYDPVIHRSLWSKWWQQNGNSKIGNRLK